MVLLTVTPAVVEALMAWKDIAPGDEQVLCMADGEPSLDQPVVGNPISHGQIVDLWKTLRDKGCTSYSLESLLRGAKVYVPPPPPKSEPSQEYKELMARLRREEEQRAYLRITNPAPASETSPGSARAFAEVNRPATAADLGDDDLTYTDVHRQLMLILNIAVSVVGVAATLWVLARWWSTPARLFLSMGGSMLVGIAEVAVYSGYVWHLGEAKKRESKTKEVKEIIKTWVISGQDEQVGEKSRDVKEELIDGSSAVAQNKIPTEPGLRRRTQKEPS